VIPGKEVGVVPVNGNSYGGPSRVVAAMKYAVPRVGKLEVLLTLMIEVATEIGRGSVTVVPVLSLSGGITPMEMTEELVNVLAIPEIPVKLEAVNPV
jgi:hypothetical protein